MLNNIKSIINNDSTTDASGEKSEDRPRPFNSLRTMAASKISQFSISIPKLSNGKDRPSSRQPRSATLKEDDLDYIPLDRRKSRSVPNEQPASNFRTRALQIRDNALGDIRANLPKLPSFQFSLPFSNPDDNLQTRSDAMANIRDMADNISLTSLEHESRRTDVKAENNRLRGLIDGLPKLSLGSGTTTAPFAGLSSDTRNLNIVVLGGYRGSILRSTSDSKMLWVPIKVGLGLRKVDLELPLEADAEAQAHKSIYADGMLTHIGPVDISRRLLKRLREQETRKYCRVHEWGYDWRLGGHHLSEQLATFLRGLEGPSLVIAHSLGGLITLHVLNRHPELFRGVLFAGTPFSGCPNILGPFRYGDGVLINRDILDAKTNFSMRSSFMLLPTHKRCFVDLDSGKEIPIDFFDHEVWREYGLSPVVAADHGIGDQGEAVDMNGLVAGGGIGGPNHGNGTDTINSSMIVNAPDSDLAQNYLSRTLASTFSFKKELAFNADIKYPSISLLRSKTTPTVRGCTVQGNQGIKDGDYSRFIFSDGDGVVTYAASDIRFSDVPDLPGIGNLDESPWSKYIVEDVCNDRGHIGLLGDIDGVERCMQAILETKAFELAPALAHVE